MRGSSVVHGLKSLVGRIHPQLPLSSKESSRLLKALTSSFREHLDEVHPTTIDQKPGQKPGQVTASVHSLSNVHETNSSTYSTDRHLASILTNPLLDVGLSNKAEKEAQAKADYEHAKALLFDRPADALTLFDSYRSHGILTVQIAQLCLTAFNKSIADDTEVQRQRARQIHRPGQRALAWLWRSGLYQNQAFRNHRTFVNYLVDALLLENCEELLWQFVKVNLESNKAIDPARNASIHQPYHWKGFVLSRMITFRLRQALNTNGNADVALKTYFQALTLAPGSLPPDISRPDPEPPHFHAWFAVVHGLSLGGDWSQTSPQLYQQLLDNPPTQRRSLVRDINQARLHLFNPHMPTSQLALDLFRQAFADVRDMDRSILFQQITAPLSKTEERRWSQILALTFTVLEHEGRYDDLSWLRSKIDEHRNIKYVATDGQDPMSSADQNDDAVKRPAIHKSRNDLDIFDTSGVQPLISVP